MTDKLAIPTPKVDAELTQRIAGTEIMEAGSAMDMSMLGMFLEADIVVKLVIISLLLASLWSWKIIIDKSILFKSLSARMMKFRKLIMSSDSLDNEYERMQRGAGGDISNPLIKVFMAGMYERKKCLKRSENTNNGEENSGVVFTTGKADRIFHMMDIARNREVNEIEKNIGFLATVGSTAPFIGLFGTVWGIMGSFQSIALSKNTSLAVVAPGLAEALFATAVGLFAAIPAVIFYNKLNGSVADLTDEIDDFSDELGSAITTDME